MAENAITTTGGGAPTSEIVKFREQLEQRASELKMVLPSHISPEKFQRTILTAAQQNPQLLTVDRRSLVLACMKAAQDGLLPDGREAAIIPFKENKKIGGEWQTRWTAVYMPMVYGLRKKILQSGEVVALEVGVVYRKEVETNHFYYEVGRSPPLGHRPSLDLTMEDAADENIVGAYSIATMKDGTKSYEFMRRFEIDKVRECSQTGALRDRRGEPRKASGPWVDWFPEQAKKTAIRRHSKTLPQSGDVIVDVEGRELEASLSSTALLDSHAGGEFGRDEERNDLIEDQSDPPHDPETGEIHEEAGDQGQGGAADQPAAEEKPAARGRGRPKAEPKAEPEKPQERAEQEPTPGEEAGLDPVAAEEQAGEHPAKAIADRIIAEINDPATNAVMDVAAILTRNTLDMAAMPDEFAVAIEIAADKKRAGIRTELAKAKAREPESAK